MSSTVHTSAGSLLAAMLAAAAAAPEQHDSTADGPCRPGVVWFRYAASGARCALKLANTRPRLLAFAEQIRKHWALYGGGPKPADTAAPKARRAVTWPPVLLKVWKEQIECGAWDDVVRLAVDRLGGIFGYGTKTAPLLWVAPQSVDGLPARFVSCRRDDGRWLVMDQLCTLMVSSRTHGSRAAAEADALQRWGQQTDEARARILQQAEAAPQVDQVQALADYCLARGIGAEPAALQPAPAAAAPLADLPPPVAELCTTAPAGPPPVLQAWQAAAARGGLAPAAGSAEAEALAVACLARYGSTDPAACTHLASFGAWHAATLAGMRAAAPGRQAAAAPSKAAAAPHPRMADALAILAAAVATQAPQMLQPAAPLTQAPAVAAAAPQAFAAAPPTRAPADKMAAQLAQLLVQHVGTDAAKLAPALRREAARVLGQAPRVVASLATIWQHAAAQLLGMAAELEAPAAAEHAAPAPVARAAGPGAPPRPAGALAGGGRLPTHPRRWLRLLHRPAARLNCTPQQLAARPAPTAGARAGPPAGQARRGPPGWHWHPPPPVAASTLAPPPPFAASARQQGPP